MKKRATYLSLTLFLTLVFTTCKKECFKTNDCNLEGKTGPCKALYPGYYYSKEENRCVEFIWGGCDGVRPFETMEECKKSCHCK